MCCHMHVHTFERVEPTNKINKGKQSEKMKIYTENTEEGTMSAE